MQSWWPLTLLVPILMFSLRAWSEIQAQEGRLTAPARNSIVGAFAIFIVMVIFLISGNA